jgi:hypothetical protein
MTLEAVKIKVHILFNEVTHQLLYLQEKFGTVQDHGHTYKFHFTRFLFE